MATFVLHNRFYGCFSIFCLTYYATSKWLWDGLELWTAIKHSIDTRVCKLPGLTSICCRWKRWDIFYCSYLTAWLPADIDTCLAAAHRSSALIHLLLHTSAIFAGPRPRKMWLHFLSNSLTDILFDRLLVSFSSVFTFLSPNVQLFWASNTLVYELKDDHFHFSSSIFFFNAHSSFHFVPSYLTLSPLTSFFLAYSPFMLCPPPLYSPPSLSCAAEFGRWRQARYWTRWSTTTRQSFIYASPMAWWSPAPRTVQSPSGTWPRPPTSASAVSLWDTELL